MTVVKYTDANALDAELMTVVQMQTLEQPIGLFSVTLVNGTDDGLEPLACD